MARAVCPAGRLTSRVAYHHAGDAKMVARLKSQDMSDIEIQRQSRDGGAVSN